MADVNAQEQMEAAQRSQDRQAFFDPDVEEARATAQPQPTYHDLSQRCPVIHNENGTKTVLQMNDILALNRSREVLGNGHSGGGIGASERLIPLDLDGPEHAKYRRILDPVFAPKQVAKLEPAVRARADELVDTFIDKGEADVYAQWCEPLPSSIFLSIMGIPLSDLDAFIDFKNKQLHPDMSLPQEQIFEEMMEAANRCYEYFDRAFEERAEQDDPGDDLIGWLIKAEVDGHGLDRRELLNISYLLMIAGLDTVAASLGCILSHLARNPERRRAILAEPDRLWPGAIEELMRFESPVTLGQRKPLVDFELPSGEKIPADTVCHVSWSAANLDPEVFDDPLEVDVEREPNRHIAFASGFHRCLGSHLARMELRAALDQFHQRIPDYEIAPGAELHYTGNPRTPEQLPLVWEP